MRTIEQAGQFKRDLKREAKGPHRVTLATTKDEALAEKHRDPALTGDWKDHRDCHIKPNDAGG